MLSPQGEKGSLKGKVLEAALPIEGGSVDMRRKEIRQESKQPDQKTAPLRESGPSELMVFTCLYRFARVVHRRTCHSLPLGINTPFFLFLNVYLFPRWIKFFFLYRGMFVLIRLNAQVFALLFAWALCGANVHAKTQMYTRAHTHTHEDIYNQEDA